MITIPAGQSKSGNKAGRQARSMARFFVYLIIGGLLAYQAEGFIESFINIRLNYNEIVSWFLIFSVLDVTLAAVLFIKASRILIKVKDNDVSAK